MTTELFVLFFTIGVLLLLAIILIVSPSRDEKTNHDIHADRKPAKEVIEKPINPGRHIRYQEKHNELNDVHK